MEERIIGCFGSGQGLEPVIGLAEEGSDTFISIHPVDFFWSDTAHEQLLGGICTFRCNIITYINISVRLRKRVAGSGRWAQVCGSSIEGNRWFETL
jgi:hypothetical protein